MRRSGLEPAWGALESNVASLALAAKLGFERIGELMLFKLQSHSEAQSAGSEAASRITVAPEPG